MTAVELMRHLQLEADELRKQKKRQNVTGLHKWVQRGGLRREIGASGGLRIGSRSPDPEVDLLSVTPLPLCSRQIPSDPAGEDLLPLPGGRGGSRDLVPAHHQQRENQGEARRRRRPRPAVGATL